MSRKIFYPQLDFNGLKTLEPTIISKKLNVFEKYR